MEEGNVHDNLVSKLGKLGESEIHKKVEQVRPPDNYVDTEGVTKLEVPKRDREVEEVKISMRDN